MTFVKVASADDIKPGSGRTVKANGKEIALFNVNGRFFAISNNCPHMGGPLGEGELDGCVVTCPLHGWQFDVTNGNCVAMPVHAEHYTVKVEGNDVFVDV